MYPQAIGTSFIFVSVSFLIDFLTRRRGRGRGSGAKTRARRGLPGLVCKMRRSRPCRGRPAPISDLGAATGSRRRSRRRGPGQQQRPRRGTTGSYQQYRRRGPKGHEYYGAGRRHRGRLSRTRGLDVRAVDICVVDGRPIPPASASHGAEDAVKRTRFPGLPGRGRGSAWGRGRGDARSGGHSWINCNSFGTALPRKQQGEDLFLFFGLSSS